MNSVPEELYDGWYSMTIDFLQDEYIRYTLSSMRRFYNVVNLSKINNAQKLKNQRKMPTERLNSAGNDMLSWRN